MVFWTRLSCQFFSIHDYERVLFRSAYYASTFMYLIAIAWIYVVLMMSIAEATNTTGSLLGALITFLIYGLLPLSLVLYIMRTPARKRAIKAKEATEAKDTQKTIHSEKINESWSPSVLPDTGGHAASAASTASDTAVRKEP